MIIYDKNKAIKLRRKGNIEIECIIDLIIKKIFGYIRIPKKKRAANLHYVT
jgi:hypothetical protein